MTTQYTPTLKLALPVTGELSGTWGDVVNDNITSMVEQAIAGLATINTWTANAHTLTTADGTTSESRCAMLVLTDTGTALSGAATVICPTASKIYIVKNTSGQSATIKTAAGTGIAVPNGETMFVFCDGTNVVQAVTRIASADVDFAKLKGTGAVVVTNILDEDNMASDSATALATQQSIKAYVDSQISANNDLSEILANGNTTGGTDLAVSAGDDITFTATSNAIFADNGKAIFGAGSDLQIYHDGTTSKIDGNLSVTNALTLFAGTANGVTYLNGSKVLTSGSALTFDGTNLGVGANITASASSAPSFTVGTGSGSPAITLYSATNLQSQISFADATTGSGAYDGYLLYDQAVQNMAFGTAATERMRLTSTGLGIGTSSPASKLDVVGSIQARTASDGGLVLTTSIGDARSASVSFYKSRGSYASPTDVVNGDSVSTIISLAYSGTQYRDRVSIESAVDGTFTSNQQPPLRLGFYTNVANGAATERMRITSAGNVGIGVDPSNTLEVKSSTNDNGIRLSNSVGSYYHLVRSNGDGLLFDADAGNTGGSGADIRFQIKGGEKARITSAGNVGIGTTSPAVVSGFVTLDVRGSTNGGFIQASNGTETVSMYNLSGASFVGPQSNNALGFITGGSERARIDSAGNVGIGTSSPNYRLDVAGAANSVALGTTLAYGVGGEVYSAFRFNNTSFTGGNSEIRNIVNGSASTGSALAFFTTQTGSGPLTERLRIDSNGNVGIGGSVDNHGGYGRCLQISGIEAALELESSSGYSYVAQNAVNLQIRNVANGDMLFYTNDTERMRIGAAGGLSFANTSNPGPFNTVLGDRNNHFTGQRSNTVAAGATSTMLTIAFGLNGAAIVRVVDAGSVPGSDYFTNVYEYFVTCYNATVTATLKQSQLGSGAGSFITTSTGSGEFNVIQTANASIATVHDTAVDVLTASSGNGAHATTTITMAANN
jgi:hypothetical protein